MALSEVAAIMARLDAKVAEIEHEASASVVDVARRAAELASSFAPVETGALRDSFLGGPDGVAPDGVHVGVDKHGNQYAEIGSNLPYASKIEYEDVAMLHPAIHQSEADLHTTVRARVHTATGVVL